MARRRRPSHRTWQFVSLVVATSVLAVAAPGTASADDPLPPAVAQYVEMVLTATGSEAPTGATGRSAALTKAGAAALEDEPPRAAEALERVATSDRYGAPVEPPARKRPAAPAQPPVPKRPGAGTDAPARPEVHALPVDDDPHVAAAAAGALSRDVGATRTVLVLAFLAFVLALLAASWVRSRPDRRLRRTQP